jgi:tetratricopeptide (TPR) repeat protein
VANGEATTGRELLIETIELIDAHPELAHWRMAVIGTLGIAHHLAGDLDQAEACYREQMERAEQAADSSELTIGANNLAELLLDTGEAAAAVDPPKPRVQDSRIGENPYVVSLTLLAEALFRSERPDEARALVPEARRRLEGLLAADPGMQMYLDRLHAAAAGR